MNASMTKNKWNQFKSDFLLHFEHQITINAVSAIHSVNHTQVINFDTIEYMKWILIDKLLLTLKMFHLFYQYFKSRNYSNLKVKLFW